MLTELHNIVSRRIGGRKQKKEKSYILYFRTNVCIMYVRVCVHNVFRCWPAIGHRNPTPPPKKKLYIGSLFYLTNIVCHFPNAIITQRLRIIRYGRGYEVTENIGQIKERPCQSQPQNGSIFKLTHCGRVTQIYVFNTVKLGTSASSP